MAKYNVEYTTTEKPSIYSLPIGAKITQVSVLPAKITGKSSGTSSATIRVEKAAGSTDTAWINVDNFYDSASIRLTTAQAKDVIAALEEIVNA